MLVENAQIRKRMGRLVTSIVAHLIHYLIKHYDLCIAILALFHLHFTGSIIINKESPWKIPWSI